VLEAPLDRRSLPEMEQKLLSTGLPMLFAAINGHPTEWALKRLFRFLQQTPNVKSLPFYCSPGLTLSFAGLSCVQSRSTTKKKRKKKKRKEVGCREGGMQ
jgi:hypothetical protein